MAGTLIGASLEAHDVLAHLQGGIIYILLLLFHVVDADVHATRSPLVLARARARGDTCPCLIFGSQTGHWA